MSARYTMVSGATGHTQVDTPDDQSEPSNPKPKKRTGGHDTCASPQHPGSCRVRARVSATSMCVSMRERHRRSIYGSHPWGQGWVALHAVPRPCPTFHRHQPAHVRSAAGSITRIHEQHQWKRAPHVDRARTWPCRANAGTRRLPQASAGSCVITLPHAMTAQSRS